jgi:hypothetical protein
MGDFQDYPLRNYPECRDCEKFAVIQDVDTDPKFYKKVVELLNYEKEKESRFTKIDKDKSLYEKIKAIVVTHK